MEIKNINNSFGFELDDLFCVGKRVNNTKRNFLFISKLLGKHIPVRPDVCKATGHLLASLCYEGLDRGSLVGYLKGEKIDRSIREVLKDTVKTDKNTLVIGFAETATGLGMSVASCIEGCTYYSTTRENFIGEKFLFSFEEEHSHASTHKCYDRLGTEFSSFDEIVLVDDEITTGNSMLNLIEELYKLSGVREYEVLTILDWRGEENKFKYGKIEKELGISIEVHSVLSGEVFNDDNTVFHVDDSNVLEIPFEPSKVELVDGEFRETVVWTEYGSEPRYFRDSGKFGVYFNDIISLEKSAKNFSENIISNKNIIPEDFSGKILVLSEGENIYIPSRIASYLSDYYDVEFKSTTRSPIYCDGKVIKDRYRYTSNGVLYNVYNKSEMEENYDLVLFTSEIWSGVKISKNSINVYL